MPFASSGRLIAECALRKSVLARQVLAREEAVAPKMRFHHWRLCAPIFACVGQFGFAREGIRFLRSDRCTLLLQMGFERRRLPAGQAGSENVQPLHPGSRAQSQGNRGCRVRNSGCGISGRDGQSAWDMKARHVLDAPALRQLDHRHADRVQALSSAGREDLDCPHSWVRDRSRNRRETDSRGASDRRSPDRLFSPWRASDHMDQKMAVARPGLRS